MTSQVRSKLGKAIRTASFAALAAIPAATTSAATLSLAPLPLFLGGVIEPNVVFLLDDSGSMTWSYMPDAISGDYDDVRGLAYRRNRLAYNPRVNYLAPLDYQGNPLPSPPFTAAWDDGFREYRSTAAGGSVAYACTNKTVNLATDYRPSWYYAESSAQFNCDNSNTTTSGLPEYWGATLDAFADPTRPAGQPAFYYIHYLDHAAGPQPVPLNCTVGDDTDNDCYLKVVVGNTGPGGVNEQQNFANWYSYYRKRTKTVKTGVSRAFAQLGNSERVGFGRINALTSVSIDGTTTQTITQGVRTWSDGTNANRRNWFNLLYDAPASGNTPARRALDDVGQYYRRTGTGSPWVDNPSVGGTNLACRQSYTILTSDGYWNDAQANTTAARANNDGTAGPTNTETSTGQSFTFQNVSPFYDNQTNTLADVAMYYWKNDLRTDVANKVPTNSDDPAFWQHMVTYTVGLGLGSGAGHIDPAAAFAAINTGATINWPVPAANSENNIDDMLHAAVNSRGGFFSAQDPQTFADAMVDILRSITDRTGSAASVVLNSGALQGNSRVYQARFQTSNWSGQLLAYALNSNGSVGALQWDASTLIPAADSRLIATFNGTSGTPFRWSSPGALTTAQKNAIDSPSAALTSSPVLDYLRGIRTGEKSYGGAYRTRSSLLGDIINSAPAFVGAPNAPYYFDSWGTEPPPSGSPSPENSHPYSAFKSTYAGRTPMIYVGANDGMLHAFNADTGVEKFAYVPAKVINTLADLKNPNYSHRYYVDGSPTTADVFFNGAWRTVLVGGLNGGGQGLYALDITNPSSITTESDVAAKVLWEFTDINTAASGAPNGDSDLGYTFSRPSIVRLNNGVWAAVFGNGYNNTDADGTASSTGNAVLYLVNVETGQLIMKLDTGVGMSADPLAVNRPNGLSTVAPIDRDGDYKVDFIYGGDLFGNLWKFDVSSSTTSNWSVAYSGSATSSSTYARRYSGQPIFTARYNPSSAATTQPITARPQVIRHPAGADGFLVLFGTGKYLEVGDNASTGQTTQTFYAVWDRPNYPVSSASNRFTRNHLLQQQILKEVTASGGYAYRISSDSFLTWHLTSGTPATSGTPRQYLGWYMDLFNTNMGASTNNYGERSVSDPLIRAGKIIFTTLLPTDDPCDFGGSGWLMELDSATGARLPYSPFDVNNDGVFDLNDYLNAGDITGDSVADSPVPASGRKSTVGIIPMPAVISDEGGKKEHKYESGSTGQIETILENPGPGDFGRQSWRQLFR
jgi:type IV pilus assembly protein PilY1